MSENKFIFEGKLYKAVSSVPGKTNCDECDLKEDCQSLDVPDCTSSYREDHRDVYFKEIKNNFESITIDPQTLAESIVYSDYSDSGKLLWCGLVGKNSWKGFPTKEAAIEVTISYFNDEAKSEGEQ